MMQTKFWTVKKRNRAKHRSPLHKGQIALSSRRSVRCLESGGVDSDRQRTENTRTDVRHVNTAQAALIQRFRASRERVRGSKTGAEVCAVDSQRPETELVIETDIAETFVFNQECDATTAEAMRVKSDVRDDRLH